MKVLWLSHFVPWPPRTGMLQRSHHLVRQAAGRHELHLAGLIRRDLLSKSGPLEAAIGELQGICSSVSFHPLDADRSRMRRALLPLTALASRWPYDVHWFRSASLAAHLEQLARGESFDLVHVDTLGMLPHCRPLAGVATVLNHHNAESQMMARRAALEKSPARRFYFGIEARKLIGCERSMCESVEVNLAVSALDAERLRAVAPEASFRVVDNGVDLEFFRPRASADGPPSGLVFAGGMSWYPNREAMLFFAREIWPALVERDARCRATILGPDPPGALVRLAREDSRVTVTGFVEDVRPHIDRAAIYVCPIRDGGGTRLKVLDALAMAKPLVATSLAVEGLGLVPEEHYLVAVTAGEFVAQIGRLLCDPALCERLGRAGRRLVEAHFSWEVIGEKLEAAYRDARELRGSRAATR